MTRNNKRQYNRLCRICSRKFRTENPRHTVCNPCAEFHYGDAGVKAGKEK